MSGVINGTAPNPVRLAEMCQHLGSALGRPSWLPVPDLALKAVLGEGATVVKIFRIFTQLLPLSFSDIFLSLVCSPAESDFNSLQVLEGQRVLPARAKELGFPFKYPYVKDALKAILS